MVAEWTWVAVTLDSFCEHDLVELVGCDAGLGVRSANLEDLSCKLLGVKWNKELRLSAEENLRQPVHMRRWTIHTVAAFLTPS